MVACGSDLQKRRQAVRDCHGQIKALVSSFDYELPDYYAGSLK